MIDLFVWPVKEDYIAVKQVSKEKATKDVHRWIFYNYLYLNGGTRKKYKSKKFAIRNKAVKSKNHYHKFLKEFLNYGTKYHAFNFTFVYNKIERFTNPNVAPKEMDYYTYEEFKKFIACEDDLKFICVFEILYYCGLRRGELRGLT